MRIENVMKELNEMSVEELQEVVRRIRRNKYTVKPKKERMEKAAARKSGQKTMSQIEKMLDQMTPNEIMKVLKGG